MSQANNVYRSGTGQRQARSKRNASALVEEPAKRAMYSELEVVEEEIAALEFGNHCSILQF